MEVEESHWRLLRRLDGYLEEVRSLEKTLGDDPPMIGNSPLVARRRRQRHRLNDLKERIIPKLEGKIERMQ